MSEKPLESDFELPVGYVEPNDSSQSRHRKGRLRMINQTDRMIAFKLASGLFETLGSEANPAYAHFVDVILLSRVIVELDGIVLNEFNREDIVKALTDVDKEYLQDVHDCLIAAFVPDSDLRCPNCGHALAQAPTSAS